MKTDFVLVGLDFGGTAIKAVAIDQTGTVIAAARMPRNEIPLIDFSFAGRTFNGLSSPDSLVAAGKALLKEIRKKVGTAPMSVAISATGSALVVMDKSKQAIVPCVANWGLKASELGDAIPMDSEEYAAISGYPKSNPPPIFQLAWMVQRDHGFRDKIDRVASISDYVASQLCGVLATEPSTAAGSGGWDHYKKTWSTVILEKASLKRKWFLDPIPSGVCLGDVAGSLNLGQTIVTTGGHDYLCAGLTANTVNENDCLNVLGTWEMVARFESVDRWPDVIARHSGPLLHDRHVFPGIITSTLESWSAGQLEWVKKLLKIPLEHSILSEKEVGIQAVHGRYFKPFLGRQLFPWFHNEAGIVGIDAAVGQNEILRMTMESLSYIGARMIEQLDQILGIPSSRIVVGGGSSRNRLLVQIKSDMLNRPILVHKQPDLSTIGAALLAGIGAGLYADHQEAAMVMGDQVEEILPNFEHHYVYRKLFDPLQWC